MNPIDEQVSLLNELIELMMMSSEPGYESLACQFEYEAFDDGSRSVGSEFSYMIKGEIVSAALIYPERRKVSSIVYKLHSVMKKHTGGDWRSFTININEHDEAITKFEYQ